MLIQSSRTPRRCHFSDNVFQSSGSFHKPGKSSYPESDVFESCKCCCAIPQLEQSDRFHSVVELPSNVSVDVYDLVRQPLMPRKGQRDVCIEGKNGLTPHIKLYQWRLL